MIHLHRQNMILNAILREFKTNNEEYLKIRYVAKQTARSALSDKRQLLKLALHAIIESWHADPTKFNFLIHGMPLASTISKSTLIDYAGSGNYHTTPFSSYYNQNSYGEILTEMIVNGAASLYGKMAEEFTNVTMTNITEGYGNKLLPSMRY